MNLFIFDQKKYRNALKKNFSFPISIIIILIIFLLGLAMFFKTKNKQISTYHFVEINNFSTYSSAKDCLKEVDAYNSKAYIYQDEKYRVLIGYYSSKSQAKNVIDKLKNKFPNSKVYTLNIEKFNGNSKLTKSQNNTIFDLIDCVENSIDNFSINLNKFEKNEISQTVFKSKIQKQIEEFKKIKDKLFKSLSAPKYHSHRKFIDNISNSMQQIDSANSDPNPTKVLRFEIMQIIFNYKNFCCLF